MSLALKNRKILSLSVIVSSIIIMLSVSGWFMIVPPPLTVQGEVEATQVKVASKIAGRIKEIYIKEGQEVEKGTLLVALDSPELEAKYRQAKAAQKAALAQKSKASNSARKEQIEAAKNLWLKAKAGTELAYKTLERVKKLYAEGVVPAQKLDEAEAQYKSALTTEEAAKASYDMAIAGAQREDREAAMALFDQASGAVSEIESYLSESNLYAPIKSEVYSIVLKLGELASPGYPVVTLVDLNDLWVTFNLREDLLADIKMGDLIQAKIPALNNKKITLRINYIAAQGDFATWRATRTSGDFDMKTFEVRGVPTEKVEGLRPGMSAIVNWDEVRKQKSAVKK
ncbi:MAG TPA: efflux RND transporter periplasmic adaptor subunit [Spirochaetota bacterium]|nr:efflux RND transporter periplasmic adaptor subunit [Spirochaetota bacterium]HPD77829.1 efflux RND transporter periplasmic adaptor subunit [Spirochaetota bacterium]HPP94809.1 efflux RND transporter periplasmic adaptor subunit [Spirochaetota bacterium]HRU64792.1 efflux RND transporter periplasmic adaptor subunit [Spirochaetota bacterium]